MASSTTDDLLARARTLPVRERIRMVRELIDSLDDEPADPDAGETWAVEIEKRARDVLAGKAVVVESGEMFQRIRDELSSARDDAPQATRGGRGGSSGGGKAVRGRRSRPR